MSKFKLFGLFFNITLLSSPSFAGRGHDQGNGGNTIECPGYATPFSLDYVLLKEDLGEKMIVADVTNLNQSLNRIENILQDKLPSLAASFSTYVQLLKNYADTSQPYIWKSGSSAYFVDAEDLQFRNLPSFCRPRLGTTVQITQSIYRKEIGDKVVFDFDPNYIGALNSLQRSFLYVHEWNWGLTKDAKKNRSINYFLHSKAIEQMTSSEASEQMKKYGIDTK